MATKPANLKKDTWNKLKESTVPATGFGEILGKLEKIRAQVDKDLATGTLTSFIALLNAAINHIPKAKKKCNSVLHKKTLALLDGYQDALKDELQKAQKVLDTYVANGQKALKKFHADRNEAISVAHKVKLLLNGFSAEISDLYDKRKATKEAADALDKKWDTLAKSTDKIVTAAIKKLNATPFETYAKEWDGVIHAADAPKKGEVTVAEAELRRSLAPIKDISARLKSARKAANV